MIKAKFTVTYQDLLDIVLKKLRSESKELKLDVDSVIDFYHEDWGVKREDMEEIAYRVIISNLKLEEKSNVHQ